MGSLDISSEDRRRILFVDSADPFADNVVGLLKEYLHANVTVVQMDDEIVDLNVTEVCSVFDAVVIGPGPGHPANTSDVGFINKIWKLDEEHTLPVLGICLGFQSLCHLYGAETLKLHRARHGLVNRVLHKGTDIFSGLGQFSATLYHSVHSSLGQPKDGDGCEKGIFWEPNAACPSLKPLAWDLDDEANGPILMGARHTEKPFWGVQFHPESICTSETGKELVKNWWQCAEEWLRQRGRRVTREKVEKIPESLADLGRSAPRHVPDQNKRRHLAEVLREVTGTDGIFLRWGKHEAPGISPTELLESLDYSQREVIFLDSQNHPDGRYSIIGLLVPGKTMRITYNALTRTLKYGSCQDDMHTTQLSSVGEIWPILQEAIDAHNPRNQSELPEPLAPGLDASRLGMDECIQGQLPNGSPFWGGFMGYISHEAGLATIGIESHDSCNACDASDINFAFVQRSIVIDHVSNQVYTQTLLPGDWQWMLDVVRAIDHVMGQPTSSAKAGSAVPPTSPGLEASGGLREMLADASVHRPSEKEFRDKLSRCHKSIDSGDSYELYLTDESTIRVPCPPNKKGVDAWALYKQLRRSIPAPFGAFVRLSGVVLAGSSPERFLSWTRRGRCQFRSVKGAMKKEEGMTSERAHDILRSSREASENLIMVDLIRSELGSVIGTEHTSVPTLMALEESKTAYELVSVIEGQLPQRPDDGDGTDLYVPKGIEVLRASLPPASVTGVPKKQSCQILRDIEQRRRGIYSGVLGYMDIGGAGDFSVVGRTVIRGEEMPGDDDSTEGFETWRVGAGGAITIKSSDRDGFLKMESKVSSVLGALLHPTEG
ncbi:para-aminobenzoate synthase [Xylaria palmicola]|nr:para-aminobenzoate synthase [Xylaria palmicola]